MITELMRYVLAKTSLLYVVLGLGNIWNDFGNLKNSLGNFWTSFDKALASSLLQKWHVLKPETMKQNERNKTTETTEMKPLK